MKEDGENSFSLDWNFTFETTGLVSFVEETVRNEARNHLGSPIYLLGESFRGALALAVTARNPKLDLVLFLVNPIASVVTLSFDSSSSIGLLTCCSNAAWIDQL
ncbi:hypothetical protein R1flu_019678 [Riccia fluitans]|uniref:Serine aminopeptidase S33 domain-containing protein n=1 Tax=Riccia fluitans TaxID=41844 RepID=A0ABD1ZJP5_9MARC